MRNWISAGLLVFFLILPWVRLDGHQALLLDIWNGRFSIFGIRFWSHDAPMLLFVLGGLSVLLAFVTSVWGRVWCGWACPQTVFVDSVFRRIERWIEGDAVTRRRLDASPFNLQKALKKTVKWFSYSLIALVLSHSFLAYFIGTDALGQMMSRSPAQNLGSFGAMALIAGAVLFDFGWFREQFCTLVCPYGRFQSVLMDERSLAIIYDTERGEPRRGTALLGKNSGDCISCEKCVHVCPTGIDIRKGLQMECVACTACADACDSVMKKIGKPPGLIRYSSRGGNYVRPAAYLAVLGILGVALVWTLTHREPVEITLIRSIGAPYQEVVKAGVEKEVVNYFKLDLLNQGFDPVRVEVKGELESHSNGVQIVASSLPLELAPGEFRRIDLFVRFPISKISEGRGIFLASTLLSSKNWKASLLKTQEVPLVGPLR